MQVVAFAFSLVLAKAIFGRWCMEHLDMGDKDVTIAQPLRSREAISIRDGSFKNEYGTAAWAIEGESSH